MTLGLHSDPLIRELLRASLSLRRDLVASGDDEEWAQEYESRTFPRQLAVAELGKLEHANLLLARFDLQDYHAMLVYFAMRFWVDQHNEQVNEVGGARFVGPFSVGLIEFRDVIERVLWDEDFLEPANHLNIPEVKNAMGYGAAAWSIANKLAVHPEELELLERPQDCHWEDEVLHYVPGDRFPADCRASDSATQCGPDCYWALKRK
tara:strand:- start:1006 stop:1626 length:621 start_codon:yes stop_codon:yes gene_type:complete